MLRIAKFKLNEVNRNISYGQKQKREANAEDDDGAVTEVVGKPPRSKSKNTDIKSSQSRAGFSKKKSNAPPSYNQDLGVKK